MQGHCIKGEEGGHGGPPKYLHPNLPPANTEISLAPPHTSVQEVYTQFKVSFQTPTWIIVSALDS